MKPKTALPDILWTRGVGILLASHQPDGIAVLTNLEE